MKSYACEPASIRATSVVLFVLIAIGVWAACGHFFYNQVKTVSAPYPQMNVAQVVTQYPHRS